MFDTMKIAGVIKQARIDKNMTQMNLADAMGVSYQAVSNWERGNSMPDISKLEDLCRALDITVEQLLGMETRTAEAVNKVIREEPLTVEELKDVAPAMEPEEVKKRVENDLLVDMSQLMTEASEVLSDALALIPQTLETGGDGEIAKIWRKVEKKRAKKKLDLEAIADLAPFLGQEYLDELLKEADLDDLDGLDELAPFLSKKTLDRLVERADPDSLEDVAEIAPFLSKETLEKLVDRCAEGGDFGTIEELAPFVSRETLEKLVEQIPPESLQDLADIAPFLGKTGVEKMVARCAEGGDFGTIEELAPFVSKGTLDKLVMELIQQGCDEDMSDLYPFLSKDTVQKLARYLMSRRDLDALEDIASFL